MAKNSYKLVSFINIEYYEETREAGKTNEYVQLLQLDYFKQTTD